MTIDFPEFHSTVLDGKRGLVAGIANEHSIAYGCAQAFRAAGAELAITYASEKAKPFVEPLARALEAPIFLPLDVRDDDQMDALFARVAEAWGRLDFLLHSIAYAPKEDLQGRLVDSSAAGFLTAIDISCHSFVRLARRAEPLMDGGGTLVTMSYYGAEKVVPNYNLMGPVKAALEACVRYLAYELGPKGIRVHAVSPGPLKTRAASGLKGFDELLANAEHRAPAHELVDIHDVGMATAYLCTPYARLITGGTIYVDGGYSILG
ncbi:MAG TPA: enoyl-ACP reductase FabI [Alphaproteobacteria bacterium]|nr:enoyl-ACP reductase FabI [Alphaproteobacteria bacterium]